MGTKTKETIAPGIYKLMSGAFRVKVAVGNRQAGGRQTETTFPAGSGMKEMKDWQIQERARLKREGVVVARGTLGADLPKYMGIMRCRLQHPDSREDEINAWLPLFGTRARHTITSDEIEEQVQNWETAGVAASTIRHRMSALSMLYRSLDGKRARNPVQGVERPSEPEPEADWRTPNVIQKVLDELWYRAAMNNRGWKTLARALVLTHTGMRPSQVMRLDPERDVQSSLNDPVPFVQVLRPGKQGRAHWKPLTTFGVDAFRLFLRVQAAGEFSTSSFYKSWMLACEAAGVARFHPYLLRHSYATLFRRSGVDVADIQELLGHKSPKTTQRYAGVVPEKLLDANRRVENAWSQARGEAAWAKPQLAESKGA